MIRFRSGGWDRARRTSGQGAADGGEYRQAAGVVRPKRLDRLRLPLPAPALFCSTVADPQHLFDKEEFFKKQIEECRELESQAVSGEDRAFWRQAVGRWEEQLRQAQRGKF
jgi:hypothetical protein